MEEELDDETIGMEEELDDETTGTEEEPCEEELFTWIEEEDEDAEEEAMSTQVQQLPLHPT